MKFQEILRDIESAFDDESVFNSHFLHRYTFQVSEITSKFRQAPLPFVINNFVYFRSFTKSKLHGEAIVPTTIGVIEDALQVLKPKNPINVWTISRFVTICVSFINGIFTKYFVRSHKVIEIFLDFILTD